MHGWDCRFSFDGNRVVGSIPMIACGEVKKEMDLSFCQNGQRNGTQQEGTGALRLQVRKGMALTAGSECVARRMTKSSKSELRA